jgi:mono/diheme cytochrome c family protein
MEKGLLMKFLKFCSVLLTLSWLSLGSVAMAENNGEVLYNQYCSACHGVNGQGDDRWPGLNESGDMTAPPHNEKGHTWRHSSDDLVKMTLVGHRDPYNATEILTMPAYDGILEEQQVLEILEYIKYWWTPDQIENQRKLDQ